MNDYHGGGKKRFGGAGRPSFGGARGGKPAFGKKSWGAQGGDRPTTRYDATCTECGKACDVPFRPVAGKPVYCRDCFPKTGAGAPERAGHDRFPRRDSAPRPSFGERPRFAAPVAAADNTAVIRQLESLNKKLDILIGAIADLAPAREHAPVALPVVSSPAPKKDDKKPAKKAVQKPAKKAVAKKKPAKK